MYLLSELMLFSPVFIYACVRTRKLIPVPALKHVFVFFCIVLFLGYPFAEMLSHQQVHGWKLGLMAAAYYCLPYLLYLTLCVVVIDSAVALMRLFKLLRPETISGARFRRARLACYLLIPALVVVAGSINNNRLKVREYSIELPRKSSALSGLKIVYASDFHLSPLTDDRLLERFVDKVNALRPDIVLIGGDVLEGHGTGDPARFEAQFRRLRAKYGVYAAPGNHERYSRISSAFFARSGIRYLEDRVEKIDHAFYLAGRKSARARMPIGKLLEAAPGDLPILLLDHMPTDLDNVSRSRVELQLSGHTHDGQLFPVNLLVMPLQYELVWGIKVKRSTVFIVSSGLQAWGPPVKTAGDSEILLINVLFGSRVGILSR